MYILISDRVKISTTISQYSYITGRLGFCETLNFISPPFTLPHFTMLSSNSIYCTPNHFISLRLDLLNIAQFLFPSFHLASIHPTLLQFTCIAFTSHSFTLIHFESLYFSSFSFHDFNLPPLTKHRSISVSFIPFGFNSPYFTSIYLHSCHFPFIYFNPLRVTLFQFVLFHDFNSPRFTKHRSISVSFIPFGFNSPYFTSIYLHSFHFPFIYFNPLRVALFQFVLFHDFNSPRLTKHCSICFLHSIWLQFTHFTSIYLHSIHFPFLYFNPLRVTFLFQFVLFHDFTSPPLTKHCWISVSFIPFGLSSPHFTCFPFPSHSFTQIHFESLYFSSFSFISLSSLLFIFLSLRPNPPMTLAYFASNLSPFISVFYSFPWL